MCRNQLPKPVQSEGIAPAKAQRLEGGAGPTWGHWQLSNIHSSASLVGSNGILVLLWGTQILGFPWHGLQVLPTHPPTQPPCTLTMRSCMRAFRWSPLVLAWAAAAWYRSIRCSSASRRVLGGGGTSGPSEGGGRVKSLGRGGRGLSCPGPPACPKSQEPTWCGRHRGGSRWLQWR